MLSSFPRRQLCLAVACLFPASATLADVGFRIENRTELLNYTISGPGAATSFYDPHAHIFHETDIIVPAFKLGTWDGSFNTTVRYTDSTQYDPDYWSLQKLELRLKDANNRIDFGDVFANASPYSMMKGIKGASFQHNFGDDRNYLRANYGTFDGQWAYVLRNSRTDEPMDRYGGSIRWQRGLENFTFGANLAYVSDRDNDPNRGTADAYRQWLPAIDWEYRTPGMVFSGEHAYSDTDCTTSTGGNCTVYNFGGRSASGTAHRLSYRGSYRQVSVNASFERVTPNFVTLGGGASPDRQRLYARADWRIDRDWRIFGSYDFFFNNLDYQLPTRTSNEIYEAGATRSHFLGRRHASLSASLKSRFLWTDDDSSKTHADRLHLKYRDRFMGDALDLGADWEKTLTRDQRTTSNTHLANNLYNLSLGYRTQYNKDWSLRSNLDLGKSEVQNATTTGYDVSNTARISLTASHPNTTELGMSYDLGENNMTTANSSSRQNRAMLYWSRRPALLQGGSVRAEASLNDYSFEDPTRNYREQLLRVVINWNLEKKPAQ